MILPKFLQDKINNLYAELKNKNQMKKSREILTDKYKTKTSKSLDLIESEEESVTYAISRMPATFSVIYELLQKMSDQDFLGDFDSVIDVGSGTGTSFFALRELGYKGDISLFENNSYMIDTFKKLSDKYNVCKYNIISENLPIQADLVMSSYMLSELQESDRINAFKELLCASKKYVLVVDTGTPKTYQDYMKLKDYAIENGFYVIAPCKSDVCPLENDYCQFYSRVERSSLHRMLKDAERSFEDEPYFYLLLARENVKKSGDRIIRRPIISQGKVELKLCTSSGVISKIYTKQNKDSFKRAKKAKINDVIN